MQGPRPPPAPITAFCSVVCQRAGGASCRAGPSVPAALAVPAGTGRQCDSVGFIWDPQLAHLIRLAQVVRVPILSEVVHDAHAIALSGRVGGIHAILRGPGEGRPFSAAFPLLRCERGRGSRGDPHTCLPLGSRLSGPLQLESTWARSRDFQTRLQGEVLSSHASWRKERKGAHHLSEPPHYLNQ